MNVLTLIKPSKRIRPRMPEKPAELVEAEKALAVLIAEKEAADAELAFVQANYGRLGFTYPDGTRRPKIDEDQFIDASEEVRRVNDALTAAHRRFHEARRKFAEDASRAVAADCKRIASNILTLVDEIEEELAGLIDLNTQARAMGVPLSHNPDNPAPSKAPAVLSATRSIRTALGSRR